MFKFNLLLSITALTMAGVLFTRGVPVYARMAVLPLLLTLSEGGLNLEETAPIRWINLALHFGVAAFVCIAALPRRTYRKRALRFFAAGFFVVFICLFFICRDESDRDFLQAAVHVTAAAGGLFFFMEWIRPPYETPPLQTPSFWVVGAIFSYHIVRLAFLALPVIVEKSQTDFTGFDAYGADLAASAFYGLFILIGVAVSNRRNLE